MAGEKQVFMAKILRLEVFVAVDDDATVTAANVAAEMASGDIGHDLAKSLQDRFLEQGRATRVQYCGAVDS